MNAIERLARYVPRDNHEHHCGFFWADDGTCDCGLGERRENLAAVDALHRAAKEAAAPTTPDGPAAPFMWKPANDALAAAVRRVEGQA